MLAEIADRNQPTQQKPGPDDDPNHPLHRPAVELTRRILEWEDVDNPEPPLSEWSTDLAAAATGIDRRISWIPTQNTATTPEE